MNALVSNSRELSHYPSYRSTFFRFLNLGSRIEGKWQFRVLPKK